MKQNQLKVFHHKYKVKYTDRAEIKKVVDRDGEFLGCCEPCNCIIYVDESLPASMSKEVLTHEIVEALNDHMELQLSHPQISSVALGFTQVLQENPKYVKSFLTK